MKIAAEVLGVEQSMNFQTMQQECFVVVEIFGVPVRAPITEEQMEQVVAAAVAHKREPSDEPVFEETRSSGVPEHARGAVQEETPERDFSVMTELAEQPATGEEGTSDGGVMELFAPSSEEEAQIAALRGRPQLGQVRDTPVVHPPTTAPRLPMAFGGTGDDDGIPQG